MIGRREAITLLGGAAVAWPLAARAQAKVYAIGILGDRSTGTEPGELWRRLLNGLRELGYVEGQNLHIDYRSADGQGERFPELVAELVRNRVNLIVTRGTPAARAAKAANDRHPTGPPRAGHGAAGRRRVPGWRGPAAMSPARRTRVSILPASGSSYCARLFLAYVMLQSSAMPTIATRLLKWARSHRRHEPLGLK